MLRIINAKNLSDCQEATDKLACFWCRAVIKEFSWDFNMKRDVWEIV